MGIFVVLTISVCVLLGGGCLGLVASFQHSDCLNLTHLCSGEDIEVAELKTVCYLGIRGRIWTVDLSPGTLYEVVFVIKIKEENTPNFLLKLSVVPPDVKFVQQRYEKIDEKPLEKWIEIVAGEFVMSPQNVGNVTFRLEGTEMGSWKSGLLVKCAILRPKN
uniref:Uncharacterized protein n=1 Tax=Quercus lobata TaxID=97700 RepID=A0A7N2LKW7_QUELO